MEEIEEASIGEINQEHIVTDGEKYRNDKVPGISSEGRGIWNQPESYCMSLRKELWERPSGIFGDFYEVIKYIK